MQTFLKKRKLLLLNVLLLSFIFQFNNCSKNKSQLESLNQAAGFAQNTTTGAIDGMPVSPDNPYLLQCISSSDGAKVSTALKLSVSRQKMDASGKISGLDWKQDRDLIATLDSRCLDENPADSFLSYIPREKVKAGLNVYLIKKEDVTDLRLFLERAEQSVCLQAAEKNEDVRIASDTADPYAATQQQLTWVGATDSFLTSLMGYNNSQLYATKVALIDTGVDYTHPDLASSMARNSSGSVIGYNSTGTSTAFSDSGYHGTHVAGLVAGGFHNGYAGSGIWGRNIAIYPVRGSNDGENFKLADLANGIIWAADQGVDIINLSLGTPSESSVVKNAISYAVSKNVLVVVAAGNDGKQLGVSATLYPAMYSTQFSGLISVGSLDMSNNLLSSFSNYSPTYVDVLSPGSNASNGIYSTVPMSYSTNLGYGFGSKIKNNDGTYSVIHGTSMATPTVTGALAAAISLARSKNVTLSNTELKGYLKGGGSYKIPAYASYASSGNYLNLPGLITLVKNKIETSTPVTPVTPVTHSLSISVQPVSKRLVLGEKISLSVQVNSDQTPSYQWYHAGAPVQGATAATLEISNLTQAEAGTYYVQVIAGTSAVNSELAEVKAALKYCD